MITRISSARRRVALVGSGVLLLGTAAVITTAAADSGNAHPAQNRHRYADYLNDQNSNDPCAQPLDQRSSGWVCPTGGSQK